MRVIKFSLVACRTTFRERTSQVPKISAIINEKKEQNQETFF